MGRASQLLPQKKVAKGEGFASGKCLGGRGMH